MNLEIKLNPKLPLNITLKISKLFRFMQISGYYNKKYPP